MRKKRIFRNEGKNKIYILVVTLRIFFLFYSLSKCLCMICADNIGIYIHTIIFIQQQIFQSCCCYSCSYNSFTYTISIFTGSEIFRVQTNTKVFFIKKKKSIELTRVSNKKKLIFC